jgi:DNA-binding MarR family transcriptional regulator
MNGKRFFELHIEVHRLVGLVALRKMAPLGLGRAQVALLRELGRTGPTTQAALARATVTDPSAATRAFAGLAARGWLVRRRGQIDRRESVVTLTVPGRRALARVEVVYDETAATLGARLDARDVVALERIRAKLLPLKSEPAQAATARPRARRR